MNAMVLAVVMTGRALYMMHCASCHGDVGQGSNVAPSLVGYSAADIHLMLDTGRMPASVPYVDEIHQEPVFTEPQMTAIVDYVPLVFAGKPRAAACAARQRRAWARAVHGKLRRLSRPDR